MKGKPQFDARIINMATMSEVLLKASSSPGWNSLDIHYVPVPPLTYRATTKGPLIGYDIEIWKPMAKYLNVNINYIPGWSWNVMPTKVLVSHLHALILESILCTLLS